MRTGTPGFRPARLIQAREARGVLSREAFAQLVGKNASTIYRWEEGEASPDPEAVRQLASALNVRVEFFLRDGVAADTPVFFRSLAATLKRDRTFQKARLLWLMEIADAVQEYIEFPSLDVPDVLGNTHYRALRDDDLERIASELRQHWGLGSEPIPNVIEVMEQAGIVVAGETLGTTNLDGLTQWQQGEEPRPFVMLADDKMSFARRQMDSAHELAHCVLHRRVSENELRGDLAFIETQAFRLASALLLPSESYASELMSPSLNAMLLLKDRWKVSIKAQIKRVHDLRMVDDEGARSLYKFYSARGWSKGEPFDADWPLQRPRMMSEALNAIVDMRMRSKADLLSTDFTIPARDLEALCGLPPGWFSEQDSSIIKLVPRGDALAESSSDGGTVLQFPINRPDK